MNRGLAKASGEYIGILESDDFLEKNAFERLYHLAKKHDADDRRDLLRGNFLFLIVLFSFEVSY